MVLCKLNFAWTIKKSAKQPIFAQKQPIFGLQKSRYPIKSGEKDMTLCEKLTQARKAAGLTQADIAARLSVSRQAVSRWESGQSKPSTEKLLALAKIYDVSLDWLCSDTDEPYENRETAELMRVAENEQEANQYDTRKTNRSHTKRVVIASVIVLAALIFACIVIVKARQKAKSIDELPYKTIEPNDSEDETFGFVW